MKGEHTHFWGEDSHGQDDHKKVHESCLVLLLGDSFDIDRWRGPSFLSDVLAEVWDIVSVS